jgi:hypothetical protein
MARNNNIYFRPIWTCGRYNENAQAAILYNLIAGMSYFFESYSAMVIGEILSAPRNGEMNWYDGDLRQTGLNGGLEIWEAQATSVLPTPRTTTAPRCASCLKAEVCRFKCCDKMNKNKRYNALFS